MKHFSVNQKYLTDDFLRLFCEHYSPIAKSWSSDGCSLLNSPFPVASFEDFIDYAKPEDDKRSVKELVDATEEEVHQLSFKHNENDLFSFNQSVDIYTLHSASKSTADFPLLKEFRSFMLSEVLPWMKKITAAPLDVEKIDLTASIYKQTDVLLCHDDELEGRRIAFIWYLVPDDWDAKMDGGCLQLFDCKRMQSGLSEQIKNASADGPLAPWNVAASLPPKRNMLAFFEVSDLSYHQVTEILTNKARVSLHGWFHGPPLRMHPSTNQCLPTPSLISPVFIEEELLYSWLNPVYLDMEEQAKIRRCFRRTSEIQLAHFLKVEKWTVVSRHLAYLPASTWHMCGPANRKHYGVMEDKAAQADGTGYEELRQLQRLFSSEAMQVILSDLTGVELHPISSSETATAAADSQPPPAKRAHMEKEEEERAVSTEPSVSVDQAEPAQLSDPQLRRWQSGSYTLLADTDVGNGARWRLETVLHITGYGGQGAEGDRTNGAATGDSWSPSWGGQVVYVASDEEGQLLTVHPKDNCLTLVYTGPGTASFVKYINHAAVPRAPPPLPAKCSPPRGDIEAAAAFDLSVIFYEPGGTEQEDDSVGDLEDSSDGRTDDEQVDTDSQEDSTGNSQQ